MKCSCKRAGVCRDFAHLAIALCRALNIPACIVVGYVWLDEPPQDFHATFEAWIGGRWVLFDPTGTAPVDRLVRIGTGRDAKDVAFSTFFGAVEMIRKEVNVLEHEPRKTADSGEAVVGSWCRWARPEASSASAPGQVVPGRGRTTPRLWHARMGPGEGPGRMCLNRRPG
jgi:hypothetical protein